MKLRDDLSPKGASIVGDQIRTDLPGSDELRRLGDLARRYAEAISESPFRWEGLDKKWAPSELLPHDDPARIDDQPPVMPPSLPGLLNLGTVTEYDRRRAEAQEGERHRRLEERHRKALRAQFLTALASNPAYGELYQNSKFRLLLESFTAAACQSQPGSRLSDPAAEALFIQDVADALAFFQSGARRLVPGKKTRKSAAKAIDRLLALRDKGLEPPFHLQSVGRFSLGAELEKWRDSLRAELPSGRLRTEKNDDYRPLGAASKVFRIMLEQRFGEHLYLVEERFLALIGYANPAAQSSR